MTAKAECFSLNELLPILILQTFLLIVLKFVALITINDNENLFEFAVKIHEFHILTSYLYNYIQIYMTFNGLIIDPHDDQLPFGLMAQLVEHCSSIAEVRVQVLFVPFSCCYLRSSNNCGDHGLKIRFHPQFKYMNIHITSDNHNIYLSASESFIRRSFKLNLGD